MCKLQNSVEDLYFDYEQHFTATPGLKTHTQIAHLNKTLLKNIKHPYKIHLENVNKVQLSASPSL